MSIWATTVSFADDEHAIACDRLVRDPDIRSVWQVDPARPCTCGAEPIMYRSPNVLPSAHDLRGGSFDLAEIPGYVFSDREDAPPQPWMRVGVNDGVVVLDRAQVVQVHAEMGRWLAATEDGPTC